MHKKYLLIAIKLTNEGVMSIKKKYQTDLPVCRVTFIIPAETSDKFNSAHLVGDFNNWDTHATQMKKMKKDGSFAVTMELATGKEYEFRYLLNDNFWVNEPEADKLVPTYFQDAENSVLIL